MTAAMSAEAAAATESGMSYLGSYVDSMSILTHVVLQTHALTRIERIIAIESLPLELQRNFTLIKQLDQKAESMSLFISISVRHPNVWK